MWLTNSERHTHKQTCTHACTHTHLRARRVVKAGSTHTHTHRSEGRENPWVIYYQLSFNQFALNLFKCENMERFHKVAT